LLCINNWWQLWSTWVTTLKYPLTLSKSRVLFTSVFKVGLLSYGTFNLTWWIWHMKVHFLLFYVINTKNPKNWWPDFISFWYPSIQSIKSFWDQESVANKTKIEKNKSTYLHIERCKDYYVIIIIFLNWNFTWSWSILTLHTNNLKEANTCFSAVADWLTWKKSM
jgi:hypothetical protein